MVYGSDEGYLSEEVAFTTAKTTGANVPVRLAAFGDMALSVAGALKTVQQVLDKYNESPVSSSASAGIDAVLHFGDLGYALGSTGNVTEYPLNRTQHRSGSHRNVSLTGLVIWDVWHTYICAASKTIPYLVSVGNHEADHVAACPQEPSGASGERYVSTI